MGRRVRQRTGQSGRPSWRVSRYCRPSARAQSSVSWLCWHEAVAGPSQGGRGLLPGPSPGTPGAGRSQGVAGPPGAGVAMTWAAAEALPSVAGSAWPPPTARPLVAGTRSPCLCRGSSFCSEMALPPPSPGCWEQDRVCSVSPPGKLCARISRGSERRRWATQRGRPAARESGVLVPGRSALHWGVVCTGVGSEELAASSPVPGRGSGPCTRWPLLRVRPWRLCSEGQHLSGGRRVCLFLGAQSRSTGEVALGPVSVRCLWN